MRLLAFTGVAIFSGLGLGWTLLHLVLNRESLGRVFHLVLCAGMGWGGLALVGFYWMLAGGRLGLSVVLAVTLAGWVGLLLLRRSRQRTKPEKSARFSSVDIFQLGLIGLGVLFAFVLAVSKPPDTWDAVANWDFKARVLFQERTLYTDSLLPGDESSARVHPRPRHALGWPLLAAGYSSLVGGYDDRALPIMTAIMFALLLGAIYGAHRQIRTQSLSLFACVLLVCIPFLYYGSLFRMLLIGGKKSNVLNGNADLPLAFFFFLGGTALYFWMRENSSRWLVASALFMTFGAYIKNEGLALYVVVLIVTAAYSAVQLRKKFLRSVSIYAGVSLPLLAPWLYFRTLLPLEPAEERMLFDSAHFGLMLDQLPTMVGFFFREAANVTHWGLLWYLLPIAMIGYRRTLVRTEVRYVGLTLLTGLGVYALALAAAPVGDLGRAFFTNRTVGRLLFHFAPITVFFLMGLIWPSDHAETSNPDLEQQS